jgi:peptidoglycan/LPS O-acetylase OafA/YrhL
MLSFLQKHFTRKLSSQRSSIATADGIRCIAILNVVFGHIFVFLNARSSPELINGKAQILLSSLFANPGLGLNIFFVLSGFLLIIPFANYHLNKNDKPSLAEYYLRRIIRLELPYFVALTFSAIFLVFVIHNFSFSYLFPRYISSIFYTNHLFYQVHPEPLPIAWSLETEVQFYILVPVIAYVFKCTKIVRRIILLCCIFLLPILISQFPFLYKVYFLTQCPFFFAGILIADIYLTESKIIKLNNIIPYFGILLITIIAWYIPIFSTRFLTDVLLYPICIAVFIYLVIAYDLFYHFFTNIYVKAIGLMSYTIYLWHYMMISGMMKKTIQIKIGDYFFPNLILQIIICVPFILLFSTVLFLMVEKPCMYSTLSKKWATKLKAKFTLKQV